MSRILMVAAEASSAQYAEQLIKYWSDSGKKFTYFGVGSKGMEKLGFRCIGFAESMAVMGFSEVIKHYSEIKDIYHKILIEVKKSRPQVAILLDYPGFNLRLSKELRELGVPVIYYISPQIWAWKKNRVYTVKENVSLMLVVFPFEEEFYKQYNVPVQFVGHPLLDDLQNLNLNENYLQLKKNRLGISPHQKVLGLMPGSRKQEIEKHLSLQLQVAEELVKQDPQLKVVLLMAPSINKEDIQDRLENLKFPLILIQDDPFAMISLVDAVLVASGTATLMVGLLEKPMVIMYKVSWLSALVGRMLYKGFFGLVNLLSKKEIVPEIFQNQATKENLLPLIQRSLYEEEYRNKVVKDLHDLKNKLGEPGVTERVAHAIEGFVKELK